MSKLVYGVVKDRVFYSDNMCVNVTVDNGLYSIDVDSDEYLDSITPADLIEFDSYVKKAKRMNYIYGYSFLDTFIPMNCMKWRFPVKLVDSLADEWELIKVLQVPTKGVAQFFFYYIGNSSNSLSNKLFELKDLFESGKNLIGVKDITPEMRLLFTFHLFEKAKKEIELQKLKEAEFRMTVGGRLKAIIEATGGTLIEHKTLNNRGYEVIWEFANERFNTWIDNNFHVIEAGVCVAGHDKIHSMSSIVNVVKLGVAEGERFHKTRTYR